MVIIKALKKIRKRDLFIKVITKSSNKKLFGIMLIKWKRMKFKNLCKNYRNSINKSLIRISIQLKLIQMIRISLKYIAQLFMTKKMKVCKKVSYNK